MEPVFYFEVRQIATNNLEERGLRNTYTKALAAVMKHGIKAEQVYSMLASRGSMKAFGVGETEDGLPIQFNVFQMEVQS